MRLAVVRYVRHFGNGRIFLFVGADMPSVYCDDHLILIYRSGGTSCLNRLEWFPVELFGNEYSRPGNMYRRKRSWVTLIQKALSPTQLRQTTMFSSIFYLLVRWDGSRLLLSILRLLLTSGNHLEYAIDCGVEVRSQLYIPNWRSSPSLFLFRSSSVPANSLACRTGEYIIIGKIPHSSSNKREQTSTHPI